MNDRREMTKRTQNRIEFLTPSDTVTDCKHDTYDPRAEHGPRPTPCPIRRNEPTGHGFPHPAAPVRGDGDGAAGPAAQVGRVSDGTTAVG